MSKTIVIVDDGQTESLKFCMKCLTKKPPHEFYRNRSTRDGLSSYCKPCQGESQRASVDRAKRRFEMNNLLASTAENAVVGLLTAVDGVAGAAIPDNPSEAITAEVTFCKDYTTKNGQFKAVIHVTVTQI